MLRFRCEKKMQDNILSNTTIYSLSASKMRTELLSDYFIVMFCNIKTLSKAVRITIYIGKYSVTKRKKECSENFPRGSLFEESDCLYSNTSVE